ncbi:Hypothetical protein NTJ_00841 [Nesidiocoris tenuis]|uniref:DUF3668 domain-containing protein n=1 Tax=Nesidiocoris tenuis TaxID=355587 RepID=A0ABN7AB16_9HEMI|nr:Hypothetical protein NTJ_00841 [Nesidiocoris tenuis]
MYALETWHKLLGLRSEAKSHAPELLLKFKIEEAGSGKSLSKVDQVSSLQPDHDALAGSGAIVSLQNGPHYLHVGPPESNELYELVINIHEAGNLYSVIPPAEIGAPITFQYSIMGLSFVSGDFNNPQTLLANALTVVEVKSQAAFLASYFKGFPNLTFKLFCGDKLLGSAVMDLPELSKFSNGKPFDKKTKIYVKTIIAPDSEAESLRPYLVVEVSLLPKDLDFFEDNVKKMLEMPRHHSGDASSELIVDKLTGALEVNRDLSSSLPSRIVTHLEIPEHDVPHNEILRPAENRLVEHSKDFTRREDDSIPVHQSANVPQIRPFVEPTTNVLPRQYIREAAQKTCEELEDWKEQQQEIFKFELKMKGEKHLKKLSDEWVKQKNELEATLKENIANCQSLYKKLEEAISDLVVRSEKLSLREEEIHKAKEELDRKYTAKFQELRKASQLHQFDMEQKVHAAHQEKNKLASIVQEKEREIACLKESVAKNASDLSKEQVTALVEDMRQLEQNLHKALQSKAFFKEQWAKALRELHELKEREHLEMKWHIRRNMDEKESTDLVHGITEEVDEMRRDQLQLQMLKDEIKIKAQPNSGTSSRTG